MTVLTVGSYHDFGEQNNFLGETLLKTKSRRISHFSIVCIIDLFHHKWEIQTSLSWIYFFLVRPGPLWLPLAPFGGPWGSLRPSSRFHWNLDGQMCQIHCKNHQHLAFWNSRTDPADPVWARGSRLIPRKWCHEVLLGPSLPHAPGARMTVVTQTPSN